MNINDREGVVRALGICSGPISEDICAAQCPYFGRPFCCQNLLEDSRDLINELVAEPRVLTWEELWSENHPQTVWIEAPLWSEKMLEMHYDDEWFESENMPIYTMPDHWNWFGKSKALEEDYNHWNRSDRFRAWSKEPTERQRKEAEWDAD